MLYNSFVKMLKYKIEKENLYIDPETKMLKLVGPAF